MHTTFRSGLMDGSEAKSSGKASKGRVNLSVREDLLQEARRLKLNLSQLAEEAIEAALRKLRADRWKEENREAIEAYNVYIREHGVWSKGMRRF